MQKTNRASKLSPIRDLVEPVMSWNPLRADANDVFEYIDLSAVDQEMKAVVGARQIPCDEAPSRARQIVAKGDVLISTVRPNINGVASVPDELDGATASTGFCVLRTNKSKLDSSFLFHWVKTSAFIADMVSKATGASYPAVSDRIILDSQIPLPPLAEQKRIAGILDAADALRAKRRAALAQLDSLTQSLFLDLFGDPVSNPMDWNKCELDQVTNKITDGTHKTPVYTNSGVEFLSAKDLKEGGIVWGTEKYISESEHRDLVKRCDPELGDILLAKSGSLGSVAMIDLEHPFSLFESLCLIKYNRDKVEGRFLIGLLRSPSMLTHLLGKNKGVAIRHLHLVDVRSLQIPLPPLPLQRRFAAMVESIERQKTRHRAHLAELDALFASLQHRAFRGEL